MIDEIAANFDRMHWWLSERGLNMNAVLPLSPDISRFDEFAGKLIVGGMATEGSLSKTLLLSIARQLDRANFPLNNLQPAQRKIINEHNRKFSRVAVKTFQAACDHQRFAYLIRRRLYVARDRYKRNHPGSH